MPLECIGALRDLFDGEGAVFCLAELTLQRSGVARIGRNKLVVTLMPDCLAVLRNYCRI